MTENWWVISLLNGAYTLVESAEKIDPREPLVWMADGKTWAVPDGRYAIVYGPCSEGEAAEYVRDVEGV